MEPGKVDQTTEIDPKKSAPLEGPESPSQSLSSSVDEGVAPEVLEDPTMLKNWDASPLPFEFTGKAREFLASGSQIFC